MKNITTAKDQLTKVINSINWEEMEMEAPEVNEELIYSIFGEELEMEYTDEELQEMFLFEL